MTAASPPPSTSLHGPSLSGSFEFALAMLGLCALLGRICLQLSTIIERYADTIITWVSWSVLTGH